MKTLSSLSRKATTAITGLTLLVITALTFTSCKKDELQRPAALQTASVNARQATLSAPAPLVFKSIKIDHQAFGTRAHDYSVTVSSNGTYTYEGRYNVSHTGNYIIEISAGDLKKINNLCAEFVSISQPSVSGQEQEKTRAIPMVITTFISADQKSSSLFTDRDNGQPVWLVKFRTQVEQILNISKLTNSDTSVQVGTTSE